MKKEAKHLHSVEEEEYELKERAKRDLEKAKKGKSIVHHHVRKRFNL